MNLPRAGRYSRGARLYDVLSGEWPVYRVGRVAAVERLRLQPGSRVLDVGCGTGLSLPLLRARIGDGGHLTGLDASEAMLGQAARRVATAGWTNVELVHGAAARLTDLVDTEPYDAVLFTYSLSIFDDWRAVWAQALGTLRPGGRAGVVDLSLPTGPGLGWWPLARLAAYTGGADPHREPWRAPEEDLDEVTSSSHRAGHVRVAVGTKRSAGERR